MAASPNIVSCGDAMVFTQSEATAAQRTWTFYLSNSADGTPATGKTLATTDFKISKAGGAFGNAVGTITEISLGWYKIVFDVGDLDTAGALACELSGEAGVDTLHVVHQVVAADPYNASPKIVSHGDSMIFQKDEATAAKRTWLFYLSNSADASAATGKTLATSDFRISKNGAAFGNAAGTITELSLGWYKIVFAAADLDTLGELACELSGEAGVDPIHVVHKVVNHDPYDDLAIVKGLANGNVVIDGGDGVAGGPTYDAHGMMTAARIRVFATAAAAEAATAGEAAGAGGELAAYTIAASGSNGRMSLYRSTED
jgi:hypothetical protein